MPKHPAVLFTHLLLIQSVRKRLATYSSLSSLYLCHGIGHQVLPIHYIKVIIPHFSMSYHQVFIPILYFQTSSLQSDLQIFPNPFLAKQRILLGMPLLTQLVWFQPIYCNLRFVFMQCKTREVLLVVKTWTKSNRAAATLISSHESQNYNNCLLKICILEHRCI